MAGRLAGKVAIVTGGGSGIGRGVVRLFAGEGAAVAVLDVSAGPAEKTVAAIRQDGGRAMSVVCDVADGAAVHAAVERVAADYGRIDVLHANAGIGLPSTRMADTSEAAWKRVIGVNLDGVYHCIHAVLPQMRRQRSGSIIVTASPHAVVTYPGMAAYAASKGGVLALTRAVALDYATEGVRCNAVLPGAIDTAMVRAEADTAPDPAAAMRHLAALQPIGRLGTPEDVAPAVLFLASDESAFVTGAALAVDGGLLARLGG